MQPALRDIPVDQAAALDAVAARVEIQIVQRHGAREVDAVAGQQSGLQRDERGGVRRAHRRSVRHSGIRIETGRDVEREHRTVAAIDRRDPLRVVAAQRPGQPDAEESVDDEPAVAERRRLRQWPGAARLPALECSARVGGQPRRVAVEDHADRVPPILQMPRDDERIAAVVAGPGKHDDPVGGPRQEQPHLAGRCGARALHQRQAGRFLLDRANGCRIANRESVHRPIIESALERSGCRGSATLRPRAAGG